MTNYNFDKKNDRSGTDSLKWDVKDGELPMWVADMDFEVCPAITDAIKARVSKPIFGYNVIPDSWYDAYIGHWSRRHGEELERDALMFSAGVVPTISSVIRRLTLPAEKVVIQPPVYNIFYNCIINNGRYVSESPLVYKNGKYDIDFADLESKLADPQARLMILCDPHNPVGKIWDKKTLAKIGELAKAHNVVVISDEIHCDITAPGKKYVPFAAVSDACKYNSVTCIAPTKAFNIAGLQTSAIYVPNPDIFKRVHRGINNDEIAEPNTFGVCAAVAALNKGDGWLDGMNAYVAKNRAAAAAFIKAELPELTLVDADATYLLWIDCSKVCYDSVRLAAFIREKTGLYICDGAEYGEAGRSFIRVNIACPESVMRDGLNRLKTGIKVYKGI